MRRHLLLSVCPALLAMYLPFCATEVRPTLHPPEAAAVSLWNAPEDLSERDLFYGPWGRERAPDPDARYTLVERKHSGINPGMTVRDPLGREWSVKQAPTDGSLSEGPVEVTFSRVLSAAGYHQPPVYYLPSFHLTDDWGTHVESGGRFRLKEKQLKNLGEWSWQQNPFVGTTPYRGLLVVLMMFNASDLKNSNNTLYEFRGGERPERWYVVRDIGTALGSTGRFAPKKNRIDAFEQHPFVLNVRDGFVAFAYKGWHQELLRGRITPEDVGWASDLLGGLSDRQWEEAFRAGGYRPETAARFIARIHDKIAEGQAVAAAHRTLPLRGPLGSASAEKGD